MGAISRTQPQGRSLWLQMSLLPPQQHPHRPTATAAQAIRACLPHDHSPAAMGVARAALLLALAAAISAAHAAFVQRAFENLRYWSTRDRYQRETSLFVRRRRSLARVVPLTARRSFSEEGMYYFFYKQGVAAAAAGREPLRSFVYDDGFEYPTPLNPLARFNVHAELALVLAYRWWHGPLRGPPAGQGDADPANFYLAVSFAHSGLLLGAIFVAAVLAADNRLGAGVVAVAAFLFNHYNITRGGRSPTLRETFSLPWLFVQMALLTALLQRPAPAPASGRAWLLAGFTAATLLHMITWQFAPFVMLTQAVALMGLWAMALLGTRDLLALLARHALAVGLTLALRFGDPFVLASWHTCFVVAALVVVALARHRGQRSLLRAAGCVAIAVVLGGLLRALIAPYALHEPGAAGAPEGEDDAHIVDLLRLKLGLGGVRETFHTRLYLMQPEFLMLPWEDVDYYARSLLLPIALLVLALLAVHGVRDQLGAGRSLRACIAGDEQTLETVAAASAAVPSAPSTPQPQQPAQEQRRLHLRPATAYHALQALPLGALALMFMRLKCLAAPHWTLVAGLIAAPECWDALRADALARRLRVPPRLAAAAALAVLLVGMACAGVPRVHKLWTEELLWDHPALQDCMRWADEHAPADAVFASDMSLTAALRLSSGRRVVNHPHYESREARRRTRLVYEAIYGQLSVRQAHARLRAMNVTHVVLEEVRCRNHPSRISLYDPAKHAQLPVCRLIIEPALDRSPDPRPDQYFRLVNASGKPGLVHYTYALARSAPTPSAP